MTWVHALQVLQLHTLQPFDVRTYVRMYLRMYRTQTNEGGMKPLWHIPMCGNLMKETAYLISIAYIHHGTCTRVEIYGNKWDQKCNVCM